MNKEVFDNSADVIFIGGDVFNELDKVIPAEKFSSVFILTDENVNKFCLPILIERCKSLKEAAIIEIPSGEKEKNLTTTAKIFSLLLENNADRKTLMVNFGGGVICDVGAFAASVYKRGIKFINIPTTLLSMVDASVGGKNGINFLERKNIIGTFTRPSGVFIYPDFIKSLDENEVRSGYAEIIKHLLLSDKELWSQMLNDPSLLTDPANLDRLIRHSVAYKTKITNSDFKESGIRMQLNFGHTYGHAIESYTHSIGLPLKHGEAIALGMTGELWLSRKLAGFSMDEMHAAIQLIKNIFNDIRINFSAEDIIPYLYADKKNSREKIGFSLLKAPGMPASVLYPDLEQIVEGLIFMSEEFSRTAVQ